MSKISFEKKQWMPALQLVANAVDKKQLLPILSSLLLRWSEDKLRLTATDLEIEITSFLPADGIAPFEPMTLPAKKLVDILRTLDDDEKLDIEIRGATLHIQTSSSQFKFATLPAADFPFIQPEPWTQSFELPRANLLNLLQMTAFAVSQQDVRVFLNGLLFECADDTLTTVGADGHRMAIAKFPHPCTKERLVFPRKGVFELLRLLNAVDAPSVHLHLHQHLFQVQTDHYDFTSKLIDAQYLPYQQAIPKQLKTFVLADVELLKRALSRILIIAHDRLRPVVFDVQQDKLLLLAQNPEQEEVNEGVITTVDGPPLKVGLNPIYLLEVLSALKTATIRLSFYSPETPILVESIDDPFYQYIIMPMKI